MKGDIALQNSYEKQRKLFEDAKNKRIKNRNLQKEQISAKIESLKAKLASLELQNQEEKEFESFDSFRRKTEEQSRQQKN